MNSRLTIQLNDEQIDQMAAAIRDAIEAASQPSESEVDGLRAELAKHQDELYRIRVYVDEIVAECRREAKQARDQVGAQSARMEHLAKSSADSHLVHRVTDEKIRLLNDRVEAALEDRQPADRQPAGLAVSDAAVQAALDSFWTAVSGSERDDMREAIEAALVVICAEA
jgi:hypothetical protein